MPYTLYMYVRFRVYIYVNIERENRRKREKRELLKPSATAKEERERVLSKPTLLCIYRRRTFGVGLPHPYGLRVEVLIPYARRMLKLVH